MRIKELFTVPEGAKVTEKVFGKVLLSSICGILLCMACLTGTTWAWFAADVENTGNVIQIGAPEINMTVDGAEVKGETDLSAGPHRVEIVHANEADDFQKKSTLYVTLTIRGADGSTAVYTTLSQDNHYTTAIQVVNNTGELRKLSWEVSWFAPVNAAALTGDSITLSKENTPQRAENATTSAETT